MATRAIQPIHRRQVSQAIIDRLLSMISDGYWTAGDCLPPQRQLAKSLNVGMSTLREALQSLQTMGVLEMRHGDGTYLTEKPSRDLASHMVNVSLALGKTDMQMLFEARGVIETGFAFFAAERGTEEQIADLFIILETKKEAIEKNDKVEVNQWDLSFHKKVAEMAGNEFLQSIVGSLFEALGEILRILPQTMEGWRWQERIAIAIRDHQPMVASEAMRTLIHSENARVRLKLGENT